MLTPLLWLAVLVVLYYPPAILTRLVAVVERRAAIAERVPVVPEPIPREPIPADLMLGVQRESEGWARDQAMAALYEQQQELGSWDAVRTVRGRG